MRALARFCAARGILVSGSDDAAGPDLEDLKRSGVHILPSDCTDFIGECDMVVFSAAIPYFHPQLAAARAQHIPTLERKAFLGLLSKNFDKTVAVSGTHGKTTVTAMLCEIFSRAGMSFTGHIGGAVKGNTGGIVSCGNEWFVTEACEYNRSFLTLSPYVTAVLNLQFDHPDCYRDMYDMVAAYDALIANTSKDGCIVCSATAERMLNLTGRRVVTFGYTRGADIYPEEVKYSGGRYSFFLAKCGVKRAFVEMKVEGKHNIANCLAAYAVAGECGIRSQGKVRAQGENGRGCKRRLRLRPPPGRDRSGNRHRQAELQKAGGRGIRAAYVFADARPYEGVHIRAFARGRSNSASRVQGKGGIHSVGERLRPLPSSCGAGQYPRKLRRRL